MLPIHEFYRESQPFDYCHHRMLLGGDPRQNHPGMTNASRLCRRHGRGLGESLHHLKKNADISARNKKSPFFFFFTSQKYPPCPPASRFFFKSAGFSPPGTETSSPRERDESIGF